jgi:hypothetical protein
MNNLLTSTAQPVTLRRIITDRYFLKAQWATIVAEQGELLAPGG